MGKNLEILEKFFVLDLKIKNQIQSLKESNEYQLTEEYIESYIKKIFNSLNDMEMEFKDIINDFDFGKYVLDVVEDKFNQYKERLLDCGYDFYKLQSFYEKNIYGLSEEIVSQTKSEIIGYSINDGLYSLLCRSKTINEMLHIMHYYIINNNQIYQSMPNIASKVNESNEIINLYGKENDLAYNLFKFFPLDVFVGKTDIVALENKVLIMIRDIGHATVFEIEEVDDKINVQYYIPKICNVDMVNNLKGVKKVTDSDRFTSGFFITDRANFLSDMFETISKIPSDDDMIRSYKGM